MGDGWGDGDDDAIGFLNEVELQVCESAADAIDAAAGIIAAQASAAIAARGRFLMALSGGSTPRPLYQRLAAAPWRDRLDWTRTHLLWSDERCVPPGHPDSNYRMVREALVDHVPVPPAQVHRMHGEHPPVEAAAAYDTLLRGLIDPATGQDPHGLDLVLLGLGGDGHTASLFPARPAGRETERWVVADEDPAGRPRLTMTPPAINAAHLVLFLVLGAGKAEVLKAVQKGPSTPDLLPAKRIAPRRGRLVWVADADAARLL